MQGLGDVIIKVPSQNLCIESPSGTYVIKAGPGSGKTYTLVKRIEFLLQNNYLDINQKILCLTFTNKAAMDMRDQINEKFDEKTIKSRIWIGTFHAFYYYLISKHGNLLFNEFLEVNQKISELIVPSQKMVQGDQNKLKKFRTNILSEFVKKCKKFTMGDVSTKNGLFWKFHEKCEDELKCPKDCPWEAEYHYFKDVLKYYIKNGLLPFELMELCAIWMIKKYKNIRYILNIKFPIILVDEFQDCTYYRLNFILLLWRAQQTKNLMVVGDEDQSIYKWIGSLPSIFDKFIRKTNANLLKLEVNFRNPKNIIEYTNETLSMGLIKNVDFRNKNDAKIIQKEINPNNLQKKIEFIKNEILSWTKEGIKAESIVIFARTNSIVLKIKKELIKYGIPISELDISEDQINEFDKFCFSLQFYLNHNPILLVDLPNDYQDYLNKFIFQRTSNIIKLINFIFNYDDNFFSSEFKKKISVEVQNFIVFNKYESDDSRALLSSLLNHLRIAINIDQILPHDSNKIRVMTHHKGKGLEFDIVFYYDYNPSKKKTRLKSEEDNICFTSLTRTKKCIYLIQI
ncbi:ATP-dependent DNA helicase Rep [Candidatus Lokiarchaeum ossiferum]|uniref:DNA 3'-5' helicase n=1 Tax=Candidatus Lokiarchaeum ossiferum TaxID=2951803 RepID=A0ABY6HYF7_9ARCH|nr:ATP-dependent DNA helicase Rep [Candidatus Lokiarchaeum sp. B-35]